MSRRRQWKPRNSSLWRTSAFFWLLNTAGNAVTACMAATPSVYLALAGLNLSLAALSWLVSGAYRRFENHPVRQPPRAE